MFAIMAIKLFKFLQDKTKDVVFRLKDNFEISCFKL